MSARALSIGGFSLVEILVVIMLLSLFVVMGQQNFGPWSARANELAALMAAKEAIRGCAETAQKSRRNVDCIVDGYLVRGEVLKFYADGTSNGAELYSNESSASLLIDPLTNRVTLIK